jgi:hypothetical protein
MKECRDETLAMMRDPAVSFPILLLGSLLAGRPAFAEVGPCSSIAIEADPATDARWPGFLADLRARFDACEGIDRCARVTLSVRDASSIVVEVALPDGRSATRSVARREDVGPTLEALLLVPQRNQPEQTPATGAMRGPVEPPTSHPSTVFPGAPDVPDAGIALPDRDMLAASGAHVPSRFRIELSIATGGRIGDGQASVGVGVSSFSRFSDGS